jgi:hypothetical protein
MVKDAENKSSLKFLHLSEARYGHCHNIWSSCGTEPFAVTIAAVKVKLATGKLTLQEHNLFIVLLLIFQFILDNFAFLQNVNWA